MRAWGEEYWDVLAIGLGLAGALVLGGVLGVAYNIATPRTTAPAIETGTAPAAPPLTPEALRAAPYS